MIRKYIILSGLILIPIVLLVLPADFFDTGQSLCLSQLLADTECPGCGMTRSMMHHIHLDFEKGYSFNKLSVIVLPIIIYLWALEVIKYAKLIRRKEKSK